MKHFWTIFCWSQLPVSALEKDITILKLLVLSKNLEFSESLPFSTKFPMFGKLLKQSSLKNTLFQLGPSEAALGISIDGFTLNEDFLFQEIC